MCWLSRLLVKVSFTASRLSRSSQIDSATVSNLTYLLAIATVDSQESLNHESVETHASFVNFHFGRSHERLLLGDFSVYFTVNNITMFRLDYAFLLRVHQSIRHRSSIFSASRSVAHTSSSPKRRLTSSIFYDSDIILFHANHKEEKSPSLLLPLKLHRCVVPRISAPSCSSDQKHPQKRMSSTSEDYPSTATTAASEDSLLPEATALSSDDVVMAPSVPSDIDVRPASCDLESGKVCICSTFEPTRTFATSKKRSFLELPEVVAPFSSASSATGESSTLVPSAAAAAAAAASGAKKPRKESDMDDAERMKKMEEACRTILECVGENPDREGLADTPSRWAKALLFMTKGYGQTCKEVTNGAIFNENHAEMVVVRNIDIHSLCEHHMVPFTGRVHIGYIPNGKVIGLSKLARIAEVYARRLQVQERLTRQIADAIVDAVQPLGVAVVIECSHMCMVMRGVQKVGASTTTSSVRGIFERNSKTRAEFFSIIHGNMIKMC